MCIVSICILKQNGWCSNNQSFEPVNDFMALFWQHTLTLTNFFHIKLLKLYFKIFMKKEDHPYFYRITSISSIISGMIAKMICHPFDTLKSRL